MTDEAQISIHIRGRVGVVVFFCLIHTGATVFFLLINTAVMFRRKHRIFLTAAVSVCCHVVMVTHNNSVSLMAERRTRLKLKHKLFFCVLLNKTTTKCQPSETIHFSHFKCFLHVEDLLCSICFIVLLTVTEGIQKKLTYNKM